MNSFFQMLIRFYQLVISPLCPPCCRYLPTCSEYARQAFARHGICTGTRLTLVRLFRCHPFCRGGYDPVPPSKNKKMNLITHKAGKNG